MMMMTDDDDKPTGSPVSSVQTRLARLRTDWQCKLVVRGCTEGKATTYRRLLSIEVSYQEHAS